MNLPKTLPNIFPLVLIGGLLASTLVSLSVVVMNLNPPMNDIRLLTLFMLGSGGFSIAVVYTLYRVGVLASFSSLRWTLLANIVLLVALIFFNVWLTAQLMFISQHDFILTIALLIFAGAVSAICVFFIANAWIERIAELGRAAQRLEVGDLTAHLEVRGNDELAQLARVFNRMIDGLQSIDAQKQQLEQTRRDLVAWVSHDLRTPLATIRAMNESILDGIVSDPQTVARYIETTQTELRHLSKLIDDLFDLAQLDAGNYRMTREQASLRDLVSDTLGSMSAKAAQLQIELRADMESGIDMVSMSPDKIQRVLYNLLDNALRHTPAGGTVSLRVRQVGAAVEVQVHNTGTPIAPADLPFVFESFFRGEPSRAQGGNGYRSTGLGLAIVRGFVEAHGGQIRVSSTVETGTTFTFTLPLG